MPIINSSSIAETKNITENGVYDVTRYTSADVNVEGTQPIYTRLTLSPSKNSGSFYPEDFGADGFSEVSLNAVTSDIDSNIQAENIKKDVTILGVTGNYEGSGGGENERVKYTVTNGKLSRGGRGGIDLSGVTEIGSYAFAYIYYSEDPTSEITGSAFVNSQELTKINGSHSLWKAFYRQTGITETGLDNITEISGFYPMESTFFGCSGLTRSGLGKIKTIPSLGGSTFLWCSSLTDIEMDNLETITGGNTYMFSGCGMTTVEFPKLTNIACSNALYNWFWRCNSLQTVFFPALKSTSFGSYTNQFSGMIREVSGCTVHFPSNLQSVIGSWSDITGGMGGTNTTVLFDLPATE